MPGRDGKQVYALGTKQRGELIRYDMKSKQFVPILQGVSATNLTFAEDGNWVAYLSYPGSHLVAQPERRSGTAATRFRCGRQPCYFS
jgi:hypothetical protein